MHRYHTYYQYMLMHHTHTLARYIVCESLTHLIPAYTSHIWAYEQFQTYIKCALQNRSAKSKRISYMIKPQTGPDIWCDACGVRYMIACWNAINYTITTTEQVNFFSFFLFAQVSSIPFGWPGGLVAVCNICCDKPKHDAISEEW